MKTRFIKWKNVMDHCGSDKLMKKSFRQFYQVAKEAKWNKPQDIHNTFNTADLITCDEGSRIIFNIGSNKYRMICGYHFGKEHAVFYIKFVGTHNEYDKIDACEVDQFKNK